MPPPVKLCGPTSPRKCGWGAETRDNLSLPGDEHRPSRWPTEQDVRSQNRGYARRSFFSLPHRVATVAPLAKLTRAPATLFRGEGKRNKGESCWGVTRAGLSRLAREVPGFRRIRVQPRLLLCSPVGMTNKFSGGVIAGCMKTYLDGPCGTYEVNFRSPKGL